MKAYDYPKIQLYAKELFLSDNLDRPNLSEVRQGESEQYLGGGSQESCAETTAFLTSSVLL